MRPTRTTLGVLGVALAGYGAFRVLQQPGLSQPGWLALWFAAAVALHDGLIAPLTLGLGVVLTRALPPRGRRYVQGGLVTGALVTVVALPLVYRQGTAPAGKALLLQDYAAHLALLLALVAAGTALAYLVRVVQDRRAQDRRAQDRRTRLSAPTPPATGRGAATQRSTGPS